VEDDSPRPNERAGITAYESLRKLAELRSIFSDKSVDYLKGVELNNKLPCVKALNLSSASSSSSGNGGTKRPRLQSRTTFKKELLRIGKEKRCLKFLKKRIGSLDLA